MTVRDGTPEEVNRFIDFLYGKESDQVCGPAANYIRDNVKSRPTAGRQARWSNFDDLRSILFYYRDITIEQLNAAIAAFRASDAA